MKLKKGEKNMKIYAMSDIHGCMYEFEKALSRIDLSGENMLILLGDYVHGPDSYAVLDKIMELQDLYGDKIVVLKGNHEQMVVDGEWPINRMKNGGYIRNPRDESKYVAWMEKLPYYYATNKQIFCHAGIDESAGEWWETTTCEWDYLYKYPPQQGEFYLDVIAGHVGTGVIVRNKRYHDIYFDGASHYYIDGTVLRSGVLPVLMYDTETENYYRITESGAWLILPYDEEY